MMTKIIVVGGGPAGMMAAISAKEHHPQAEVRLLEKNRSLGIKLSLTGGGRCNLCANMNIPAIIDHVPKNGRFLHASLNQMNAQDIMQFFMNQGVDLIEENDAKIFPASGSSKTVLLALENRLKSLGVLIHLSTAVNDIDFEKKDVITSRGMLSFDFIILATGGFTYPTTGSDGAMLDLLKSKGFLVTPLNVAETSLVSNDPLIQSKLLQGVAVENCQVIIKSDVDKKGYKQTGDILFTHFGLSGKAAISSSHVVRRALENKENPYVQILFPKESLPKRLLKAGLDLDNFVLPIHDVRGILHAFVTDGGIDLINIDPKTLKHKHHPFVSFAGEMIDCFGHTGGFNLTIAFSTGYTAGKFIL